GADGADGADGAEGPEGPAGSVAYERCLGDAVSQGFNADGDILCLSLDGAYTGGDQDCLSGYVSAIVGGAIVCSSPVDNDTLYDGTDFALSNQDCGRSAFVQSIDVNGGILCASPVDNDTTYTEGYGLALSGDSFSVRTDIVVTRVVGVLNLTNTDGYASMSTVAWGGVIDITVVDRVSPETMYNFACMKVNLSVVICKDMQTGVSDRHLFNPGEQIHFTYPNFEIITYMDSVAPYDGDVIVRATGNNIFYTMDGGR
ncbi:MAG: hypothetical protein GWP91_18845, partial [Rhodobacterales bacterium]|nr:hypothetical protein [Rhodobacterales bacterium]